MKSIKGCVGLWTFSLLVFVPAVRGCVPIFPFAFFAVVPIDVASSVAGIKVCEITAGIKKLSRKSQLSRKTGKKHYKIVLLEKTKLNTIEVLISKVLIALYINHERIQWDEKNKSKIPKMLWNKLSKINGNVLRQL